MAQQVTLLVHGGLLLTDNYRINSSFDTMPFVSTENGVQSAERITAALYSKSADSLAQLEPSELSETFRDATMVDILLEPATSVLDMVMKANCFANESKIRQQKNSLLYIHLG